MAETELVLDDEDDEWAEEALSELGLVHAYAHRLEEFHRNKRFNRKQGEVITAIFHNNFKRVFIRKGRKGGGTETVIYVAGRIAGCNPNMAVYIIGPTLTLQREILWNNGRLINSLPKSWKPRPREAESRIVLDNGSYIKVHGADNHAALSGIEADVFIFDELKDHDPRAYGNCYPNIASRDAYWIVLGSPPKNKNNFYYKLETRIRQESDWYFTHWTTWDNAEFLPGGAAWIQNEKERYYRTSEWDDWESEYEARYVFGGKRQVIPHFDSDKHILPHEVIDSMITKDRHKLDWWAVFDPGYATCFAVLFVCWNRYSSELFFMDEIYETDRHKLSITDIWPRVVKIKEEHYSGKWRHVYDSAAPGFPQEVRARHGKISFTPTYKEKGDEEKFFRLLNSVFYTDRGYVSERCKGFINEIENYLLDEGEGYPDKNNHQLDNVRYFLKMSGYKMLESPEDIRVVTNTLRGVQDKDIIEPQKPNFDYSYFEDFHAIDLW